MHLLLLSLSILSLAWAQDYSWPMYGGNLQRNNRAENATMLKNPNMTWAFFDPNGEEFISSPVYDYLNGIVWTSSDDGFVYAVDANNGTMIHEVCAGKPPTWQGDPCGGVIFDDETYGQVTLLNNRDAIVIFQTPEIGPDVMVRISLATGDIVWKLTLYTDSEDPEGNSHFMSLPSVISNSSTSDSILIWVMNVNDTDGNPSAVYTIIDSETGKIVFERPWLAPLQLAMPPLTVDPEDGNVISQYVDVIESLCGDDESNQCTGLAKFDIKTGEVIWNNTMGQAYSNGLLSISKGVVQVSTTQLYAYSYTTAGEGRWQIMETAGTYDMYYPAICSDETVIFTDDEEYIQGWTPQVVRNKKAKFWEGCNGQCSRSAVTTGDMNFYTKEDNTIVSHSCVNGKINWSRDFGLMNSYVPSIAIGYNAIYANVYKSGSGGALIKMEDLDDVELVQHTAVW